MVGRGRAGENLIVDSDSQAIVSSNVSIGPSNDGVILREMVERGDIPSCNVLLADSGYVTLNITY